MAFSQSLVLQFVFLCKFLMDRYYGSITGSGVLNYEELFQLRMSSNVTEDQLRCCYERLCDTSSVLQGLRSREIEDLNQRITRLEIQLSKTQLLLFVSVYSQMTRQVAEQERQISDILANIKGSIPSMYQKLKDLEQATDDYENFVKSDTVERLVLKIWHLEQAGREKDVILWSLKSQFVDRIKEPRDGVLTWRIDNSILRIHEARTGRVPYLDSPVFRTGNTGYRMRLRLYLNGYVTGKGSHLSIFLTLMDGSYNQLLDWPFKQKVTFTLLCPGNPTNNISKNVRPDAESPSFGFTEGDIGLQRFAPVSVLEGNSFIQKYTLFFQCVVDNDHYMPDNRKDTEHFI